MRLGCYGWVGLVEWRGQVAVLRWFGWNGGWAGAVVGFVLTVEPVAVWLSWGGYADFVELVQSRLCSWTGGGWACGLGLVRVGMGLVGSRHLSPPRTSDS